MVIQGGGGQSTPSCSKRRCRERVVLSLSDNRMRSSKVKGPVWYWVWGPHQRWSIQWGGELENAWTHLPHGPSPPAALPSGWRQQTES